MRRGNDVWVLVSILLVCLVLYGSAITDKMSRAGDDSFYLILAESIASGNAYREINHPDNILHAKYPPVFPLILSFGLMLFNEIWFLKLISLVFGLGCLVMVYLLYRKSKVRDWVLLLMAFSPYMVIYSSGLFSDVVYLFISLVALYFGVRRRSLFMIVFGLVAYYTRNIGVVLIGGGLVWLMLNRKVKEVFVSGFLFVIGVFPWLKYSSVVKSSHATNYATEILLKNPYAPELGRIGVWDLIVRVFGNLWVYVSNLIPSLVVFPVFYLGQVIEIGRLEWLIALVGLVITLVMMLGFFKQRLGIIEIYVILYFGLLLVWPWTEAGRFLVGVMPFLLYYFVVGLRSLVSKRMFKLVLMVFIMLNLIGSVGYVYREHTYEPEEFKEFYSAIVSIESGVVMSRKPEIVYTFSGLKGIAYPYSSDEMLMLEEISKVDYVIIDSFSEETELYLKPIIFKYGDRFESFYKVGETEVFRVR
ncbi:glycosyltransferase family 39 protein [Candidatus Woesearchaeota archaeon]|nr:glycosyltransferase family 39 protein [Candidatus Woesearchaeota archaeon]